MLVLNSTRLVSRLTGPVVLDRFQLSSYGCRFNGAKQHHPVSWFDNVSPGEAIHLAVLGQNSSQGSVPTDLAVPSDLAFVFNENCVRAECGADPLRRPR